MKIPHNIYIHVPFCMSKCNYCAFFSRACKNPDWDAYTSGIIDEINNWAAKMGNISVPTIFFGGGTPSLIPTRNFDMIMRALQGAFKITPECEITLESNPGTLDAARLGEFKSMGVNRLSVGIQSLDDNKLQFLGRRHNARTAINLLEIAQGMRLRTSGDFIYGLPDETTDDIIKICSEINALGLQHCSMYELTIEPDTPFGKMNLDMPSNDTMADMYNAITDTLALPRYEVSNYATAQNICQHNYNIWDGEPYIGIGPGAAGRVLIDNIWYEQRGASAQFEKMSTKNRAIEKIITGLRQIRGVKITPDVADVINMEYIEKNPDLFQRTSQNRIATTEKGLLILDDLMLNLVR